MIHSTSLRISMIAAMASNRIIGANNKMPWHLPADLKHFKRITLGKPVIMGRKTYESIGKALPGRHNIVISRQQKYALHDADLVHSIDDAISLASQDKNVNEVMIIGGGALYEATLPFADRLYLTFIDANVEGDTLFPDFLAQGKWISISKEAHEPDEKNPFSYTFHCYERVSN